MKIKKKKDLVKIYWPNASGVMASKREREEDQFQGKGRAGQGLGGLSS